MAASARQIEGNFTEGQTFREGNEIALWLFATGAMRCALRRLNPAKLWLRVRTQSGFGGAEGAGSGAAPPASMPPIDAPFMPSSPRS